MNTILALHTYNQNYSILGDTSALVLCLVSALIMRKTFLKHKNMVYLIYFASYTIIMSSSANIFRHVYLNVMGDRADRIFLYIINNSYYINLLILLILYMYYIVWSIGMQGVRKKLILGISGTGFLLCSVLVLASNLTGFGTVILEDGKFFQSFVTPFDLFYGYCIIVSFTLLYKYKSKVVQQIRQSLIEVEFICFCIYVIQKVCFVNSMMVLTFLIPVITLLFLQHSNAYDLDTGALDADSFDILLKERRKKEEPYSFMILKWSPKEGERISPELKKVLYNFWDGYIKQARVFCLQENLYVLAIREKKQKESKIEASVKELLTKKFPVYYDKYHVDYRLQVWFHDTEIDGIKTFLHTIVYFLERQEVNSVLNITEEMLDELHRNDYILQELQDISEKQDMNDSRVLVYCQPVKDAETGIFSSAEALMRLKLDDLGIVMPNQFIPIAEKNDLIHTLSLIILHKVCGFVQDILKEGYYLERISVNFSIIELRNPAFCEEILAVINEKEIPCNKIAIELTESENDTDYQNMIAKVNVLQRAGVKFYLDDFGTGYSNFDRILDLGLDIVKFDRSLLLYADQNVHARFMVEKFSEIFRQLNYKILFEGVENEELEQLCMAGRADFLQGYLYSKPIPIEKLSDFLVKD